MPKVLKIIKGGGRLLLHSPSLFFIYKKNKKLFRQQFLASLEDYGLGEEEKKELLETLEEISLMSILKEHSS